MCIFMYFPRFPRETLDFRIESKEEDPPTPAPPENNLGENEVFDVESGKNSQLSKNIVGF